MNTAHCGIVDEETYSLVGKGTGRRYLLGDRVKIRVVRASMEQKLIDYELIEEPIAD
jgi:ribonuclease R